MGEELKFNHPENNVYDKSEFKDENYQKILNYVVQICDDKESREEKILNKALQIFQARKKELNKKKTKKIGLSENQLISIATEIVDEAKNNTYEYETEEQQLPESKVVLDEAREIVGNAYDNEDKSESNGEKVDPNEVIDIRKMSANEYPSQDKEYTGEMSNEKFKSRDINQN